MPITPKRRPKPSKPAATEPTKSAPAKGAPAPWPVAGLSKPAERALAAAGITSLAQLAKRTEADIAGLHGIGPTALPKLRAALTAQGLSFKKR